MKNISGNQLLSTKTLPCIVVFISMVTSVYAQVTIKDTGLEKSQSANFLGKGIACETYDRRITLDNNSPNRYTFTYRYNINPTQNNQPYQGSIIFPYIGDQSLGSTGLGLDGGAWLNTGFIDIMAKINSRWVKLTTVVAGTVKASVKGDRGIVDVQWTPEWGNVNARFVSVEKDNKLYVEIGIDSEKAEQIRIRLFSFPGHLSVHSKIPHDRWFSTVSRNIQNNAVSGPDSLDAKNEYWVFIFDTQNNKMRGSCAALFLPEEISEASIDQRNNNLTTVSLTCSIKKVRLLLWQFPEQYLDTEAAYMHLKENGGKYLNDLRMFNFEQR